MIENAIYDLRKIDDYQRLNSGLHTFDPTFKLFIVLFFLFVVISCDKYDIPSLIYLGAFPVLMFFISGIPFKFFFRKILFLSPLVVFSGIFNPFLDTKAVFVLEDFYISGGVLSLITIVLKYIIIIFTVLIYVSSTRFEKIIKSFQNLRFPRIFITQFILFYSYLFVITEEALKMLVAYRVMSGSDKSISLRIFPHVAAQLFVRAYERSQRVYNSMLLRGFLGEISLIDENKVSRKEIISSGCFVLFIFVKFLLVK